jgi:hypothetical protein
VQVEKATGDPSWDETMELLLHGSSATLYVRVYDAGERNVRQDPMGETELKVGCPRLQICARICRSYGDVMVAAK